MGGGLIFSPLMPKGVYIRSPEQIEKIKKQLVGIRPPKESLAAHYASMRGDGNPAKRQDVRKKISEGRKGIAVSEETRQKISATRHERYFNGKRGFNRLDRLWRKMVFERDQSTCQMCHDTKGPFHADHIKSVRFFPELRHELSNGRVLCIPCHRNTPNFGGKRNDGTI